MKEGNTEPLSCRGNRSAWDERYSEMCGRRSEKYTLNHIRGETCADSSDVFLFAAGRGRQPIDIRLSVMAVTRRGWPIESITSAEALVESCGDGEPQKKKRATEQSISSSRGETLGSPVYER
ncbi:UNVERIFIED_CONTAM: hypothetical protein FKN15_065443 [Acipenser sinensis]